MSKRAFEGRESEVTTRRVKPSLFTFMILSVFCFFLWLFYGRGWAGIFFSFSALVLVWVGGDGEILGLLVFRLGWDRCFWLR